MQSTQYYSTREAAAALGITGTMAACNQCIQVQNRRQYQARWRSLPAASATSNITISEKIYNATVIHARRTITVVRCTVSTEAKSLALYADNSACIVSFSCNVAVARISIYPRSTSFVMPH